MWKQIVPGHMPRNFAFWQKLRFNYNKGTEKLDEYKWFKRYITRHPRVLTAIQIKFSNRTPRNLVIFKCPGRNSTRIHLCFTPIPTPWAKQALPLPGREQQASGLAGLIPSVKQPRCRWGTALWLPGCCHSSRFLIPVSKYLVDHRRVFDW